MKKSKAELKFERVMREFGNGKLTSHGKKVTDHSMALAIAFKEARKINPNYEIKAEGGIAGDRGKQLEKIYSEGTAKELWEFWDEKKRSHFLIDHAGQFFELMGEDYNKDAKSYAILSYDTLPSAIRKELMIHHAMGIYKDGGPIPESPFEKLKSQLDDLAIDLEGEDEENLAILRYDLSDVDNKDVAARLIRDYENNMLEQISDADIKKQIKESISEYRSAIGTKMYNGGEVKLSPAKKKILNSINTLKEALENANESAKKSIQNKLAKLQAEFDHRPSTKEKIKANKGKFAMDVPSEYARSMYKKLWGMHILPSIHKLNGTSSIVVNSRNNLAKAYRVYSDLRKQEKKDIPPLSKISRKL